MKPTLVDYIPLYGFVSYFNRYFAAEKRGTPKEIQNAMWFQIYQLCVTCFTIIGGYHLLCRLLEYIVLELIF